MSYLKRFLLGAIVLAVPGGIILAAIHVIKNRARGANDTVPGKDLEPGNQEDDHQGTA